MPSHVKRDHAPLRRMRALWIVCAGTVVGACGQSNAPLPDASVPAEPDAALANDAWVCRGEGEPCFSIGECCSDLCYLDTHTCLARP